MGDTNIDDQIDGKFDEIYMWLNQTTFSRPRKNIGRDFSNGVFMAELLKRYYPRYVDLHNYSHTNSLSSKIYNWCTLNNKVFSKMNIKLSDKIIYQVATCHDKVIENILTKIRSKILEDCNEERNSLYSIDEQDEKIQSIESILNYDQINATIPRSIFLKIKEELHEKHKIIARLNEKILHLENLIKLKNQRIADLSAQIIISYK